MFSNVSLAEGLPDGWSLLIAIAALGLILVWIHRKVPVRPICTQCRKREAVTHTSGGSALCLECLYGEKTE